jgi:hypothetical protein
VQIPLRPFAVVCCFLSLSPPPALFRLSPGRWNLCSGFCLTHPPNPPTRPSRTLTHAYHMRVSCVNERCRGGTGGGGCERPSPRKDRKHYFLAEKKEKKKKRMHDVCLLYFFPLGPFPSLFGGTRRRRTYTHSSPPLIIRITFRGKLFHSPGLPLVLRPYVNPVSFFAHYIVLITLAIYLRSSPACSLALPVCLASLKL